MTLRLPWALLLLASCAQPPPPPAPAACEAIAPLAPGLPDDVVWGFADLHAHPAIERAFKDALVWGGAVDDAPVNGDQLPRIAACPVETHLQPGTGPIDRAVGLQIFPAVAAIAEFAHGPVGTGGHRTTNAWPNARDVIHQQMNVASIRRAYEGGLRLMFAATTDDQVIAALLTGPNFVDGFVPNPSADYDSAKRQIALIQSIAASQSSWMGIARTPAEARCLIRSGRLALVVSAEMNGFGNQDELDLLVRDDGVRHVFPIHLIDNDIGGSAANASLFNSATAAVSALYRKDHLPMQYMNVNATPDYARPLDWPQALVTAAPPVYVGLAQIPFQGYAPLCYEPLAACTGAVPALTSFIQFGQQNLKGLCTTANECHAGERPGATRIRQLMDAQLMIDVSHMSATAVMETVAIDGGYPLIASHGDVGHLCRGSPTRPPCTDSTLEPQTERNVDAEMARQIVRRQGVLGLGTGLGNYFSRPVISARASPLLTLDPASGVTVGCAAIPGTAGCEPALTVDVADAGTAIDTLVVGTEGAPSGNEGNAQPFVRVELRDPVERDQFQRRVILAPLVCSGGGCSASVPLGAREAVSRPKGGACDALTCAEAGTCGVDPYTVDDVEQVTLEWLYLGCDAECQKTAGAGVVTRQCASTWNDERAPRWPMSAISLSGGFGGASVTPLAQLGPRASAPLITLDRTGGAFAIYLRNERPSTRAAVLATGHLLKVSVTSGAGGGALPGSSAQQVGANACVAVRRRVGGECRPTKPPARGATECPAADGWVPINQRGEWQAGLTLYTFVRFPGDESTVCGVDLAVLDWLPTSPAFEVAGIRVDATEDPVGHWVRRYVEVTRHVADGQLGAVTFGTDFNGLNGMTDISEFPVPAGAMAASACPATAAAGSSCPPVGAGGTPAPALPLNPMRFRNRDGTLGEPVLIEERGLATYGLLADFVAIAAAYPGCGQDVHDSLMLSAEATLRAWEAIVDPTAPPRPPLPKRSFACGTAPGFGP